jgi:hypothetical protein
MEVAQTPKILIKKKGTIADFKALWSFKQRPSLAKTAKGSLDLEQ